MPDRLTPTDLADMERALDQRLPIDLYWIRKLLADLRDARAERDEMRAILNDVYQHHKEEVDIALLRMKDTGTPRNCECEYCARIRTVLNIK